MKIINTQEPLLHILIIDNYDSFSFNLVESLRSIGNFKISVLKNDDLTIFCDNYDAMIISPGPGLPEEAAFLLEAIDYYKGRIPILGICLGLQAIVQHYGGKLVQLETVFHGIKDTISIDNNLPNGQENILFQNLQYEIEVGRYHSWIAKRDELPKDLTITAVDNNGSIMGVQDISNNCFAVQFHPESYMTKDGLTIFNNFIDLTQEFIKEKIAKMERTLDFSFFN